MSSLSRLTEPRSAFFALLVAAVLPTVGGCIDNKLGTTDPGHDLDGADTDTDTDTDADTDADGDSDTDTDSAEITSVAARLVPSVTSITTRDTVNVVVTATWSDGSTSDITAASTIASSDTAVLDFYEHDVGQPLFEGSVDIEVRAEGTDLDPMPLTVTMAAVKAGDLVFNEVLADPATTADPNQDGDSDPVDDEFVEIANAAGVTLDVSGVTLWDADLSTARHTFPSPTYLYAGQVLVVFGGGTVSRLSSPNARFFVADNEDHSLQYGVALNNEGDRPHLVAANGATALASAPYGDQGGPDIIDDASYVLSPEVTGSNYTHHAYVSGSVGDWSPGTHADGSAFPGPDGT